jgi:hypothetical protein
MKSIRIKFLVFISTVLTLGLWFTRTDAQNTITTTININEYDILFLTDIINVKTQKLNSTISGFSVDLVGGQQVLPPQIRIYMKVLAQLRGDAHPGQLLEGRSIDIPFTGRLTLTARDFVMATGGIAVLYPLAGNSGVDNSDLKKRMTNFAQTTGAAPPGTYYITVKVVGSAANPNAVYGSDSKTIVIPYSAVNEAFIEINDPKDGSFFSNLAPTFSWTTNASTVQVSVFEAGVSQRSPQDALTGGNPCLIKTVSGATLTYPQNASRQLQENKAYVLQVEALVSTNRGEAGNFSRPVVFRITNDNIGKMLDNFLSTSAGNAFGVYSSLRDDPSNWVVWPAYGSMTLDGGIVTEADLQGLLHDLSGNPDLNPQISIENQ